MGQQLAGRQAGVLQRLQGKAGSGTESTRDNSGSKEGDRKSEKRAKKGPKDGGLEEAD